MADRHRQPGPRAALRPRNPAHLDRRHGRAHRSPPRRRPLQAAQHPPQRVRRGQPHRRSPGHGRTGRPPRPPGRPLRPDQHVGHRVPGHLHPHRRPQPRPARRRRRPPPPRRDRGRRPHPHPDRHRHHRHPTHPHPDRRIQRTDHHPEPGPQDTFVVTGGARGVTAACAIGLAKRYKTRLLLLGRTEKTGEPAHLRDIPEEHLKAAIIAHLRAEGGKPLPKDVEKTFKNVLAQREIQSTLDSIKAAGAQAEYIAVDVTDAEATANALRPHHITGIVHGAGVLADQLIVDKKAEDVRAVLGAKLHGLRSVLDAVGEPRHILLFSSVAGFFGNRGQSDYAMANEALNRVAVQLRRELPASRVTSVVWGAWAGGMVTPELERMFTERGVTLISLQTGVDYFTEQFTEARSADVVTVVGPNAPLSTREITEPTGTVRRSTAPLVGDPVLADHAIGGVPVLPATAAIGALLGTARQLRDFAVLKGVTLGDDRPEHLDFVTRPDHVLVRDEGGRPRYRATATPGTPAPERIPGLGGDAEPYDPYAGGALFHGPSLRGITGMVSDVDSRLVLRCELSDADLAGGAYRAGDYSPVLADLLLQAALVRVHRAQGLNSLPAAVAAVQVHGPLPDGEPFLVVVEPESGTRATVTACALDGRVLLRFKGVDVVPSATLTFEQEVRR
ncbi:SDR family NAD(P)-dependent oxidoreductase [Actinosynnema sp. CA-248983]